MVPNPIEIPFEVTNPLQTLTVSNSAVSIERSKIDALRNYHRAVEIARTLLQLSSHMCLDLASCKLIEFPRLLYAIPKAGRRIQRTVSSSTRQQLSISARRQGAPRLVTGIARCNESARWA